MLALRSPLWLAAPLVLAACTYDWEKLDPRLGDGAGGSAAAGNSGGGGSGGTGGTVGGGGTGGRGGTGASGGSVGGGGSGGGPLGPFGPPQAIPSLTHLEDDDDPTFTADLLELFFNSDRGGGQSSIWRSSRTTASDPWGAPEEVHELSSDSSDTNPTLSPDGLTIWLSSSRDGSGSQEIHIASRVDRDSPWSTPVLVPALNSPEMDLVDAITDDGLIIILSSSRGTPADDVNFYVSTRASVGQNWGAPVPIAELNTAAEDSQAWLSPDRLTLYFDSDRAGPDSDLFVTTRSSPSGVWQTPVPVTELNTGEDDSDACLSPDQRYIMFARSTPSEGRDLFEAFR